MKEIINKKSIFLVVILCLPLIASAQTAGDADAVWTWILRNIFLIMAGAALFGVMISFGNLISKMLNHEKKQLMIERGIEVKESKAPRESFFKKMYDKAWSLVPMEQEGDIDLGHDYDGIRELDNRLPPWWVWMFNLTIVWGVVYVYIYHISDLGMSQKEEYVAEMQAAEEQRLAYLARQTTSIDETNVVALTDEADLAAGKDIYDLNCATCHGFAGEGGIGPNMTDEYWVHGGGIKNIFKRVKYGVPEKGMIAWKSQLQPESIQKVSSYILTLEGTNPPNGKAPEGDIYIPEEGTPTDEG
ncbi:MAG: c-type cytochrome [Bacteroidia bacterium]|nr:c-type cytochrome [Bacteroidia bacterium]